MNDDTRAALLTMLTALEDFSPRITETYDRSTVASLIDLLRNPRTEPVPPSEGKASLLDHLAFVFSLVSVPESDPYLTSLGQALEVEGHDWIDLGAGLSPASPFASALGQTDDPASRCLFAALEVMCRAEPSRPGATRHWVVTDLTADDSRLGYVFLAVGESPGHQAPSVPVPGIQRGHVQRWIHSGAEVEKLVQDLDRRHANVDFAVVLLHSQWNRSYYLCSPESLGAQSRRSSRLAAAGLDGLVRDILCLESEPPIASATGHGVSDAEVLRRTGVSRVREVQHLAREILNCRIHSFEVRVRREELHTLSIGERVLHALREVMRFEACCLGTWQTPTSYSLVRMLSSSPGRFLEPRGGTMEPVADADVRVELEAPLAAPGDWSLTHAAMGTGSPGQATIGSQLVRFGARLTVYVTYGDPLPGSSMKELEQRPEVLDVFYREPVSTAQVNFLLDLVTNGVFQIRQVIERMDLIQQQKTLALVYSVGHPLKHRTGSVTMWINTAKVHLRNNERLAVAQSLDRSAIALKRVANLGHFLDILSRIIRNESGPEVFLRKDEWHSHDPLDLHEIIENLLFVIDKQEQVPVELHGLDGLERLQLEPWYESPDGRLRPSDLIYDEIFAELIINASKHGVRTGSRNAKQVSLEVTTTDRLGIGPVEGASTGTVLVFENAYESTDTKRLNIQAEAWVDYALTGGSLAVGGLMFVAEVLRRTGAGRMFIRMDNDESSTRSVFRSAIMLQGLGMKEA